MIQQHYINETDLTWSESFVKRGELFFDETYGHF